MGKLTRFQVVPGLGWDNLRNIEMNSIFAPNYTSCIVSMDGRFFLPLYIQLLPKGSSSMEIFAELFDHYYKYKSLTARSINVDAGGSFFGVGISGSFSEDHQHTRVSQLETKSVTTRVSLRQALYTVLKSPEMPLSNDFLYRLREIGYQLSQNATDMAMYLSDMIVADYGTHYISRVDAGGILWKQDTIQVQTRSLSVKDVTDMKAAASVSFRDVFHASASWSKKVSTSSLDKYMMSQSDSRIHGHGGIPVRPNLTIDHWSSSLYKNLVPVNRAGDPIYFAVTPENIRSMSYHLVNQVRQNLEEAVKRYYSANTIKGCMTQGSSNFNPLANVPENDCSPRTFNFTFGGVYQICQGDSGLCSGHNIANIITGGSSCSSQYTPVLLHSRRFACREQCESYWIFWKHCQTYCSSYSIYWCAAKKRGIPQETGYLFGGLYSPRAANPVTQKFNCPLSFLPFKMGTGDFTLCLSRDFGSQKTLNAVSFGGFFSCATGNPYTVMPAAQEVSVKSGSAVGSTLSRYLYEGGSQNWPHGCPKGFSQHLANVDGNCEIMFCSTIGRWSEYYAVPVKPPPFVQLPKGALAAPMPNTALNLDVAQPHGERHQRVNSLHGTVVILSVALALVCIGAVIGSLMAWRKIRRPMNPEQLPILAESNNTAVEISE